MYASIYYEIIIHILSKHGVIQLDLFKNPTDENKDKIKKIAHQLESLCDPKYYVNLWKILPHTYVYGKNKILILIPVGLFHEIIHPKEIVLLAYNFEFQNMSRRDISVMKFSTALQKYKDIKKEQIMPLSHQIESSCYNYCFDKCILPSWENNIFKQKYNTICGLMLSNLDPDLLVYKESKISLISKLLRGEIYIHNIAYLIHEELFPELTENERRIINRRLKEKIELKTSNLYRCPKCKKNETTYYFKQIRSLDEPTSIFCICQNCKFKFQAG